MKIYIFADMEGISGVSASSFVLPGQPHYNEGRAYLTEDINVCAQACFDAGADEVVVTDGHCDGLAVLWEKLIPGIKLVQGSKPYCRFFDLEGTDGVILLGYHAMAGTQRALLEHTFNSLSVQNMWVNGKKIGEFGIDTAIAGDHGVPVIMTSGCDKLCAEAKAFHPDVVTCQIKTSISQQGAMLLSPSDAHFLLRSKTFEAIEKLKAGKIKPVKLLSPVKLRIEYVERLEPQRGLVADRTVEYTGSTMEEAYLQR